MRKRHHEWLAGAGAVSLILGGAAGLTLLGMGLPSSIALACGGIALVLIGCGTGAFVLRRRMQRQLAPNAEAAARILLDGASESRVLTRERYEELLRAELLRLPSGVHAEVDEKLRVARELLDRALAQSKVRDARQIAEAASLVQLADAELHAACSALGVPPPAEEKQPPLPHGFGASVATVLAEQRLSDVRAWMERRRALVEQQLAALADQPRQPYR
jgi:hypothetical protein